MPRSFCPSAAHISSAWVCQKGSSDPWESASVPLHHCCSHWIILRPSPSWIWASLSYGPLWRGRPKAAVWGASSRHSQSLLFGSVPFSSSVPSPCPVPPPPPSLSLTCSLRCCSPQPSPRLVTSCLPCHRKPNGCFDGSFYTWGN